LKQKGHKFILFVKRSNIVLLTSVSNERLTGQQRPSNSLVAFLFCWVQWAGS